MRHKIMSMGGFAKGRDVPALERETRHVTILAHDEAKAVATRLRWGPSEGFWQDWYIVQW